MSKTKTSIKINLDVVHIVCAFFVVAYIILYLLHPQNPFAAHEGLGWYGWWDQSKYILSANALAQGNMDPAQHWYPLGYPVLGAIGSVLSPKDPFLIVNAILLSTYVLCFLRLFEVYIGTIASIACLLLSFLLPITLAYDANPMMMPVLLQFTVPWNTIAISTYYMLTFLLLRSIRNHPKARYDVAVGAIAAIVLFTRPSDALPLIAPGIYYLYLRTRSRIQLKPIGGAVFGFGLVFMFFSSLMLLIYGGFSTPYSQVGADGIGLGFSNLTERFYAIFIDALPTWGEQASIFAMQPWLYILFPAAIIWAMSYRSEALMILATIGLSILIYLAYNDFAPLNVFRFQLLHYFTWWIPVIAAAGVAGLYSIIESKRPKTVLSVIALSALALASYRAQPVAVAAESSTQTWLDAETARVAIAFSKSEDLDAVDFPGLTFNDWTRLTSNQFEFSSDGTTLKVFRHYRVVPFPGGIRIIFNADISVQNLQMDLTDPITGLDRDKGIVVRPLRFNGRLEPLFWRRRAPTSMSDIE